MIVTENYGRRQPVEGALCNQTGIDGSHRQPSLTHLLFPLQTVGAIEMQHIEHLIVEMFYLWSDAFVDRLRRCKLRIAHLHIGMHACTERKSRSQSCGFGIAKTFEFVFKFMN